MVGSGKKYGLRLEIMLFLNRLFLAGNANSVSEEDITRVCQ